MSEDRVGYDPCDDAGVELVAYFSGPYTHYRVRTKWFRTVHSKTELTTPQE